MTRDEKRKRDRDWHEAVQNRPLKAAHHDLDRFVRSMQESRERQFEGKLPAMSKGQIIETLNRVHSGKV